MKHYKYLLVYNKNPSPNIDKVTYIEIKKDDKLSQVSWGPGYRDTNPLPIVNAFKLQ